MRSPQMAMSVSVTLPVTMSSRPDVLDDEIGRRSPQALIDRPFQECPLHHDAT